ncbi:hypothetical protein H0H81_003393, partial [Sphagnurus paluster]
LKASSLPTHLGQKPKSYVSIKIGSSLAQKTFKATGDNPEWNQVLTFDVPESSMSCVVEIVRVSKFFGKKVIAKWDDITVPSVGDDTTETYVKSKIQLFFAWKITGANSNETVTAPPIMSTEVAHTPEVPGPDPIEPVKGTIAHLNQFINAAQPAIGSDGKPQIPGLNTQLTKVMGYVKKLVDIGGHIAEVS